MKHSITLFIADRKQNAFMQAFDMRPDYKWYINCVNADITTSSIVDEQYLRNIIEKSKDNDEFWVPAVKYQENLFVAPEVKILSDGQKEMLVS